MKRFSFYFVVLSLSISAYSANYFVSANGNDSFSGLSPQSAFSTIQKAVDAAHAGDTVFVASGVYNQSVNLKDGVNLVGDMAVLDGTGLGRRLISTVGADCKLPTLIEGFVLQNARHNDLGGAALLNGTITMRRCVVRACSGVQCGGLLIHGEAAEASALGARVEHCVIHNCSAVGHDWPDAGGVANFNGTIYYCTIANNYGDRYGGIHSESSVYYTVMWGNMSEDGFVDPANYVSDESTSGISYANEGFEPHFFAEPWLDSDNNALYGPGFVFPTNFAGAPDNEAEHEMVLAADYSLLPNSLLLGKAGALGCITRTEPATSVNIVEDTLVIENETQACLHAIVLPYDAAEKHLSWKLTDNENIISIDRTGKVTAKRTGITTVKVLAANSLSDSVVVVVKAKPVVIVHRDVLLADSLYKQTDYTVPSYIPFLVAKETARCDSSAGNLKLLKTRINELKDKEEPYCMVANINGDPRHNMAFCWFTNEGITRGVVQLIRKPDATAADFESGEGVTTLQANATTTLPLHYAISTSGILKAAGLDKHTSFTYVSHKALAGNLKAGSTYSWRVGYEGHWSQVAQFRTADRCHRDFSFIYMTDSHIQNQYYIDEARRCAEAVAKNEKDARFCVFPGDFVDTGTKYNSEWEWERWFEEALKPVIMQMPIVPTDGNHDDSPLLNYTYHFNTDSTFNMQSTTKPQFEGITYSFVYGDMLLLAYSMQDFWVGDYSYEDLTSVYFSHDLATWFWQQINKYPKARYRVALVHKNLFSGSDHQRDRETPLMRATLLPVFKECELDLVLQGHDHTYEVIGPVDPDTRKPILSAISEQETVPVDSLHNLTGKRGGVYDVSDGTMYFIGATCGAKRYTPLTREEMDKAYNTHKLDNYFDLFTGMFGQPGAPSYTRVTVTRKYIKLDSFKVEADNTVTLFNSMRIVRSRRHTKL